MPPPVYGPTSSDVTMQTLPTTYHYFLIAILSNAVNATTQKRKVGV